VGKAQDLGNLLHAEGPHGRLWSMVMVRSVVRIRDQINELITEVIQSNDFFKG
jgi:hypothetical protein